MTGPETPNDTPRAASATALPARKEVHLDPALHARMLAQMHEEQAAAIRKRELTNWVLLPLALFALVLGIVLMFSHDMVIAFLANTVATGIAWILWRVNRERIRDVLGR